MAFLGGPLADDKSDGIAPANPVLGEVKRATGPVLIALPSATEVGSQNTEF
jgi:hypothetical protein